VNEELAAEMLKNITISGSTETRIKPIIASHERGLGHVLNLSSGSPRIQTNVINRFILILSQPSNLNFLNPFEIRCCLCSKVINYPCWYLSIKYSVNHFHYFVCFDNSSAKLTAKCYRGKG
jgi:hypothetical protein